MTTKWREAVSTPDEKTSRLLPRRPQIISPAHSIPPVVSETPIAVPYSAGPATPFPQATSLPPPRNASPARPQSAAEQPENASYENAIDFATHSWDLATGGLRTLTAKREFPTRLDRRSAEASPDAYESSSTRNYVFAMIVLICIIVMLIGGGVVLFVMLQP